MAVTRTQISAQISAETKELLERHVRLHGLKKNFVIESALLHYFKALQELPPSAIVPPRVVVSRRAGERLLELVEEPPAASAALQELAREQRGRRIRRDEDD